MTLKLVPFASVRQVAVLVEYKGMKFDEGFRADIIVENKVILELKSVEQLSIAGFLHAYKRAAKQDEFIKADHGSTRIISLSR